MFEQKAHLILTVDYELFGNGSGDIEHCLVNPADTMVSIADKFGAKLTFFVETMEFVAMEQEPALVDEVGRVRQQLIEVMNGGRHDVQLHLHPQWASATYLDKVGWDLDMSKWRIGDIGYDNVSEYLKSGKQWLDELLIPFFPGYKCLAFRAGGWCIQPSEIVVDNLLRNDFKIESTVAPGFHNVSKGEWSDFRKAPDEPYWRVEKDICQRAEDGILEVPIVTGKIGRWRHLQSIRRLRPDSSGGLAPGCCGNYQGPDGRLQTTWGKLSKLRHLGNVMLDFSTMPVDVLIDVTRQWFDRYRGDGRQIPVVAIAHTKNFSRNSAKSLEKYMAWVSENNMEFSTYRQWLDVQNG